MKTYVYIVQIRFVDNGIRIRKNAKKKKLHICENK